MTILKPCSLFWGMSRDRETFPCEDLRYVGGLGSRRSEPLHAADEPRGSTQTPVAPGPGPLSPKLPRKPFETGICHMNIAVNRRGDPRTTPPRTIGYRDRSLAPQVRLRGRPRPGALEGGHSWDPGEGYRPWRVRFKTLGPCIVVTCGCEAWCPGECPGPLHTLW
jgi:hypothetical protein